MQRKTRDRQSGELVDKRKTAPGHQDWTTARGGGRDNSNHLARAERLEEKVPLECFISIFALKLAILSQCASAVFSVFQTTDCSLRHPVREWGAIIPISNTRLVEGLELSCPHFCSPTSSLMRPWFDSQQNKMQRRPRRLLDGGGVGVEVNLKV